MIHNITFQHLDSMRVVAIPWNQSYDDEKPPVFLTYYETNAFMGQPEELPGTSACWVSSKRVVKRSWDHTHHVLLLVMTNVAMTDYM